MTESNTQKPKWEVERRLGFIEFRLYWQGHFNRSDLVKQFRISIPQASNDINRYQELAPDNMEYDRKQKVYLRGESFKPTLITPNADLYLSRLSSLSKGLIEKEDTFIDPLPEFDVLSGFQQAVKPETLRTVLDAIKNKKAIEIEYQSMSRPEAAWRWISPHAIASDGFRWHVRAFCHSRFQFRDFVLTRILDIKGENHSYSNPDDDKEWNTLVTVKVGSHPELSESQRKVIELDYGMKKGVAEIKVRNSLLFYFLQQHGFMKDEELIRPPRIQQIVLLNKEEVQKHLPSHISLI